MRISRLAKWTLGFAGVGLLVLQATPSGAAPTSNLSHRGRINSSHAPDASREFVLGTAMQDRLQSSVAQDRSFRVSGRDRHADRRLPRSQHGDIIDLLETTPKRKDEPCDPPGNPTNPIPEPSSVLLFAAGVGLVSLTVRRKLV